MSKLAPTLVSTKTAKTVAAAEGRKRGVLAINDEGKLVVCCRRTIIKNGWKFKESLHGKTKAAAPAAPAKKVVVSAENAGRRAADPVVTAAKKAEIARKARKGEITKLDDLLA